MLNNWQVTVSFDCVAIQQQFWFHLGFFKRCESAVVEVLSGPHGVFLRLLKCILDHNRDCKVVDFGNLALSVRLVLLVAFHNWFQLRLRSFNRIAQGCFLIFDRSVVNFNLSGRTVVTVV